MKVPLTLSHRLSECPPAWRNFVAHHNQLSGQLKQSCWLLMKRALSEYGAWTNWDDDREPIWFPDSESLTQFMLTWG